MLLLLFDFRVVKDQTVQAVKASDNITGVNLTKRSFTHQTQENINKNNNNNNDDNDNNANNLTDIAIASKQTQHINKQTTDTQVNATGVNNKSKTTNLKTVRETKSSVFDRLHKTPIRNMKANSEKRYKPSNTDTRRYIGMLFTRMTAVYVYII